MKLSYPNPHALFAVTSLSFSTIIYIIAKKVGLLPHSWLDWTAIFVAYGYSVMAMLIFCGNSLSLQYRPKNTNLTPRQRVKYDYTGTSGDLFIFLMACLLSTPVTAACYYTEVFDFISIGFASLTASTITGLFYLRNS